MITAPPTELLRRHCDDAAMWREVFEDDDYKVVAGDVAGRTVLDVGAGVGAFSVKCLGLGASRVVGVEPNPETCEVYRRVLKEEIFRGEALLVEGATWSAGGVGELHMHPNGYRGCDSLVTLKDYPAVQCSLYPLADLIAEHRPHAIKIDAELSEYEMLKTLPDMTGVETMWVEFHETRRHHLDYHFRMTQIVLALAEIGFENMRVKDADGVVVKFWRVR